MKIIPKHVIKLLKPKDKEQILKVAKEKGQLGIGNYDKNYDKS